MFNYDKLANALAEYKNAFPERWEDENYKWFAIKQFQDNWDINAENFGEMFAKATEKTFNLLASMNNFPRQTIIAYSEVDDEAVRAMFINLFDESKSVEERVEKFQTDAEQIRMKYNPGTWQQHYQRPMAITVYLWLRYPEKYYIYKYSVCRATALALENEFVPKKGKTEQNLQGNDALFEAIREYIVKDEELQQMYKDVLTAEYYQDVTMRNVAFDLGFYITNFLVEGKKEDVWFPEKYDPGISKDQWVELILDESVFTESGLQIIKRIQDYGGMATCKQLSIKYGESNNFYNAGSVSLAKRIAEKTGCSCYIDKNQKERFWPILYLGRNAEKEEEGSYTWKLRHELLSALDEVDLSDIALYAQSEDNDVNYWFLNANPKIWSFSDIAVGETQSYTLYNDNGNKRRIFQNFLDAKTGDIVIGYESTPRKQVVALGRIAKETDEEYLYFEKTEVLGCPIDYAMLKDSPELEKMEYFTIQQGSMFKLTKGEFDFIMDMIREENPIKITTEIKKYTKEDFLSEVFMTAEQYDTLTMLLENKQNLILQGAPGVGKTFAAKRLAYSIMGKKDDSRVEFVQFHQNYSYEDFVMGYRPHGDGFELQYGIFYRFCQKASSNPEQPYFFIIDEINRGNMSKIFGELLMLIEKDYRGIKMTLAYDGMTFAVPKNLYIIGMMNTADRSLAMIDYALRRRFSFFEMVPGFSTDGFVQYLKLLNDDTFNTLIERVKELNKEIAGDSALGTGFCIGHSYFCGKTTCTEAWLETVAEYDVIPMLKEYWFDEPQKVQKWSNILRGVFND